MESFSEKQQITRILDHDDLLIKSELVHLSDLSGEELEFVKQAWMKANVERRRQIISHLIQIGQTNFKLDFSNIFLFCLSDPDQKVRAQAIAGLVEEENGIYVSPLVRLLREDSSAEIREAAATALGKFAMLSELGKLSTSRTNEVYTALLEVLENTSESVNIKGLALEAIAPLNVPRVRELIEEIYHSNEVKLKDRAIRAMGRNCDPQWLTVLQHEFDSTDPNTRYEAVNACGELGAEEAVPDLLKLIEDKDVRIQEAAITALGEIGGTEARQALDILTKNPKKRISRAAKSALEEIDFCEDPLFMNH